MSESALIKVGSGNGERGRGVRHHSEATAWKVSVTAPKKTTSKFNNLNRDPGPFDPDTKVRIGWDGVINTGDKEGLVYINAAELNSDGSIIDEVTRNMTVAPNGCCALSAYREYDAWASASIEDVTCRNSRNIHMKKSEGTYYFGLITWGEDEDKPPYPTPETLGAPTAPMMPAAAAPAAPEKWCTPAIGPIPEICLESWQWGVVAGVGIAALGLTYVGVRKVRGKPVI